jgi:hypothetical protein
VSRNREVGFEMETMIKRALKQIVRPLEGRKNGQSAGFWVTGGSLVYIPRDRANEVGKLIRQHREHEAEMARVRMLASLAPR